VVVRGKRDVGIASMRSCNEWSVHCPSMPLPRPSSTGVKRYVPRGNQGVQVTK
jgi:hypothetical protein